MQDYRRYYKGGGYPSPYFRYRAQMGLTLPVSANYLAYPGATNPEEFTGMQAAQQGKQRAIDYIQTPRYKRKLNKFARKSGYPKQLREQLYNERLQRAKQTTVGQVKDSPYSFLQGAGHGYVGPGSEGKINYDAYVDPTFDISKFTVEDTPLGDPSKTYSDIGMEEVLHGTHYPLTRYSETGAIEPGKPAMIPTFKNILPEEYKIIEKNMPSDEEFSPNIPARRIKYIKNPTEVLVQIPQLREEYGIKGNIGRKDFKNILKNPTLTGERWLQNVTGQEKPYEAITTNPKLRRTARKRTTGLGKLAYQDPYQTSEQQTPMRYMAQDGVSTNGNARNLLAGRRNDYLSAQQHEKDLGLLSKVQAEGLGNLSYDEHQQYRKMYPSVARMTAPDEYSAVQSLPVADVWGTPDKRKTANVVANIAATNAMEAVNMPEAIAATGIDYLRRKEGRSPYAWMPSVLRDEFAPNTPQSDVVTSATSEDWVKENPGKALAAGFFIPGFPSKKAKLAKEAADLAAKKLADQKYWDEIAELSAELSGTTEHLDETMHAIRKADIEDDAEKLIRIEQNLGRGVEDKLRKQGEDIKKIIDSDPIIQELKKKRDNSNIFSSVQADNQIRNRELELLKEQGIDAKTFEDYLDALFPTISRERRAKHKAELEKTYDLPGVEGSKHKPISEDPNFIWDEANQQYLHRNPDYIVQRPIIGNQPMGPGGDRGVVGDWTWDNSNRGYERNRLRKPWEYSLPSSRWQSDIFNDLYSPIVPTTFPTTNPINRTQGTILENIQNMPKYVNELGLPVQNKIQDYIIKDPITYPNKIQDFDPNQFITKKGKRFQHGGRYKAQDGTTATPLKQSMFKSETYHGGVTDAMMKGAIARNSNIPFVRRMTQQDPASLYMGQDEEGYDMHGTHQLGSYGNYVLPRIVREGSSLRQLPENEVGKYHKEQGYKNAMYFDDPNDAIYFAEHYKDVAPMMDKYRDHKAYGGAVEANTPEMQQEGLRDQRYDKMYFPGNGERRRHFTMEGMTDSIYYEGLDDYNNVVESGVKHPGDEDWMINAPNVYEKRLKGKSNTKKTKSFAELIAEHNK